MYYPDSLGHADVARIIRHLNSLEKFRTNQSEGTIIVDCIDYLRRNRTGQDSNVTYLAVTIAVVSNKAEPLDP